MARPGAISEIIMESMNPPVLTPNAPRIIQSLELPHFGETAPGPLHTILTTPDGSIYYSDELNHTVVSLNGDGSIRWQKTKHGTTPGEFWYPKGLSLGYLQLHGDMIHCLAVADSWNRRVQFLGSDGNILSVWTHAGEMPFGEVADIRFVAERAGSGDNNPWVGFWYVLDRGNHRLCRMAINGNLVDQIGRCLPRKIQRRWAIPEIFFSEVCQDIEALACPAPCDFTFYPEGILGNALDALFIIESGYPSLKQIAPPHLFPLHLCPGSTFRWIAADASGLLAHDPAGKRLWRQSIQGKEFDQAGITGRPVFSNLSSDEVWLQIYDRIEKYKWDAATCRPEYNHSESYPWISWSASKETKRLDPADVSKAIEGCLARLDEEIKLADTILAMGEKDVSPQFLEGMSGHIPDIAVKCSWALQKIHENLHWWCLGRLEHHLAGSQGHKTSELSEHLRQMQGILAKEIEIRIADIQKRVDDLSARMQSQKAGSNNGASIPHSWMKVASMSKSNLEFARKWASGWSGIRIC
jgi:hypothetical protein